MADIDLGTARGRIIIDSENLDTLGSRLQAAGRDLMIFGGAALYGFQKVMSVTMDFEKVISNIGAVSEMTGKEIEDIKKLAVDLGKATKFGATEVADGFLILAKAGFEAKDVIGGVGEALVKMAAASDIGLEEASEMLSGVISAFQLTAEDSVKVVDTLVGAVNKSQIDMKDFAYTLKYVNGVANTMGFSIEEVAVATALLGENQIKGSSAGTGLRRILSSLSPSSSKATEMMMNLGIVTEDGANKFFDAQGNAKSLREIFEVLGNATNHLSDEQKTLAFTTLFGRNAMNSAMILAREGTVAYDEMADAIGATDAYEVADKMIDNLAGAVEKLKSEFEALFISAGTPLHDTLKNIVLWLARVVGWIGNLPPGLLSTLMVIGAVIGAVSLLSGAFLLTFGTILNAVRAFKDMADVLKGLKGVIGTVTGAMRAFTAASLANPWILLAAVIAAVVAGLVYLYFHSEKFRAFIDNMWQGIQKVWKKVTGFLGDMAKKAAGFIIDITNSFGKIGDAFANPLETGMKLLRGFKDKAKGLFKGFWKMLFGDGDDETKKIEANIKKDEDALKSRMDNLRDLYKTARQISVDGWSNEAIENHLKGLAEVERQYKALEAQLKGLNGVKNENGMGEQKGPSNIFDQFIDRMPKVSPEVKEHIKGKVDDVIPFADTFEGWDKNKGPIDNIFNQMQNTGRATIPFAGFVENLWDSKGKINDGFTGVKDTLGENRDFFTSFLKTLSGKLPEALGEDIGDFWGRLASGGIKSKGELGGAVKDFAKDVDAVGVQVGNATDRMKGKFNEWAANGGSAITRFVTGIPGVTTGLNTARSATEGTLNNWKGSFAGFFGQTLTEFSVWGSGIVTRNALDMDGVGGKISGTMDNIQGKIGGTLDGVSAKFGGWGSNLVAQAQQKGSEFVRTLLTDPSKLPDFFGGIFTSIGTKISQFGDNTIGSIRRWASNIWSEITGVWDRVGTFIDNAINRIVGFIAKGATKVGEAAGKFAGGIWKGFKDNITNSPYTKMEYMMWTMEDNVLKSLDTVKWVFGEINKASANVGLFDDPSLTVSPAAQIIDPAVAANYQVQAAALARASEDKPIIVQGPLVGIDQANMNNEQDIKKLSQDLNERVKKDSQAKGKKVLTNAGR